MIVEHRDIERVNEKKNWIKKKKKSKKELNMDKEDCSGK